MLCVGVCVCVSVSVSSRVCLRPCVWRFVCASVCGCKSSQQSSSRTLLRKDMRCRFEMLTVVAVLSLTKLRWLLRKSCIRLSLCLTHMLEIHIGAQRLRILFNISQNNSSAERLEPRRRPSCASFGQQTLQR
mmetsp:Transcript_56972/g.92202  ORF Transcript_56972/g.92202 Transcript_56972/m.92202 type:complete len:132 (+) Transcript_56972:3-398(+)